jgi:beta-galactosidase
MRFLSYAMLAVIVLVAAAAHAGQARIEMDLSGPGWKLWLDKNAKWENDPLFLPPVDIARLPYNSPTGGWDALPSESHNVAVPGTVEEYLQHGDGPAGDIKGVSWWVRRIHIPNAGGPRRLLLQFEAVRQRAEVFINRKLVGYDVIGNTPFEVDITDAAGPGEDCELAVRITDPGGNFDWRDSSPFSWGTNAIPMSHGFGGITGGVKLISCAPVYVDDIYVQNTPAITKVNVIATLQNDTDGEVQRSAEIIVRKKSGFAGWFQSPTFTSKIENVTLAPGSNSVTFHVAPDGEVKVWDLDYPNLYVCKVRLLEGRKATDSAQQTFGFRWFAPEGFGSNAVFRLNGQRIVLRTAISWGFWPITGIFPTPELAAKQIEAARAFGLNMLNFHRGIGQPEVLDQADRQGLLYFEEPGAYANGDRSPFAHEMARTKLLRMVQRDRSHPSLVIYNMINEAWDNDNAGQNQSIMDARVRDMRDAHALDPSRTITHTSAWASGNDYDLPKMHMRPFDDAVHYNGWFDFHHAGGPEVWNEKLYQGPDKYYNRTTNRGEIVYWGEEGAISTPPRLELIKKTLDASPLLGWDGQVYLDWYKQFDDFLDKKNLHGAFPTVDALTTSMGAVSLYHQGRKIETIRLNDATDGYAINGWESEIIDDHSGIVDCFRNPKADPAILAYYNQPLYVAVKTRSQFAEIPGNVTVDFYLINEKDVRGPHHLDICVRDPAGHETYTNTFEVTAAGGEVYGQLLEAGVTVPIAGATGMFTVEASLLDPHGHSIAVGHDQVLAVDWKSQKLGGRGATWESVPKVRQFLDEQKGLQVANYQDDLGPLDWVVVTRAPNEGNPVEISGDNFRLPDSDQHGLTASFFTDPGFEQSVHQRTDATVNFSVPDGATPDPALTTTENYGVRWEGQIVPSETGETVFATDSNDGVRLWVNGQLLFDDMQTRNNLINRGRISLEAGKPVAIRLEYWHRRGNAQCRLLWSQPESNPLDPEQLIQRVRDDGTTLLILDRADTWMGLIQKATGVKYHGSFTIGTAWLGGLHFVCRHPLFDGLPVNTAMDWPYQAVVSNGKTRSGLLLEGEDLVAGAWHCYPMKLGTAVGVIPCGKGKIVVSTLNIADELNSSETSACVPRKLLCNFIAFH